MDYDFLLSGFIIALSVIIVAKILVMRHKIYEKELYSIDIGIPKATEMVLNKFDIKNRYDLIKFDRTVLIKNIKNISDTHWNTLKYPESAIRKKYCKILPGYKK